MNNKQVIPLNQLLKRHDFIIKYSLSLTELDIFANLIFNSYDVSPNDLSETSVKNICQYVHTKCDKMVICLLKSEYSINNTINNIMICSDITKIIENIDFFNNVNVAHYIKHSNFQHVMLICDALYDQNVFDKLSNNGINNIVGIFKNISERILPFILTNDDGWKLSTKICSENIDDFDKLLSSVKILTKYHPFNDLMMYLCCKSNTDIIPNKNVIIDTLSDIDNLEVFHDIQNQTIINSITNKIYEEYELVYILKLISDSFTWDNDLLFNRLCENLSFCETNEIVTNVRDLYKNGTFKEEVLRELVNNNAITLEDFVGDAFNTYTNKFNKLGAQLKIDMSITNLSNVLKLYKCPTELTIGGENEYDCKICYASKITTAFTGCGHTVCETCATSVHNTRYNYGNGGCPFCRKYSTTIKLYT